MKILLLIAILFAYINSNAQFTCSSAYKFQSAVTLNPPAVGTIPQVGPDYGCFTEPLRPVWLELVACQSGTALITIHYTPNLVDSLSIVVWGPFQSSLNACSQLTAANIVYCSPVSTFPYGSISINNVLPGEIYYAMLGVSDNVQSIFVNELSPLLFDGTCNICNSQVSILQQEICIASADSATAGIKVIWEENANPGISSYTIYRESTVTGIWDSLATIQKTSLSEYVDLNADPGVHPWKYKISANDSCGNSAITGFTHRTIHLQSSPSLNNAVNLSWTYYSGINYNSFYIYRGLSSSTMILIDSVSSGVNSYTDYNSPGGTLYYQLEIRKAGGCTPSRTSAGYYNGALSNISVVSVITEINEIVESGISIAPNPFQDATIITLKNPEYFNAILLYSMDGRILKTISVSKDGIISLPREYLSKGIYIVELVGLTKVRKSIIIL